MQTLHFLNAQLWFWIIFLIITYIIFYCDKKYGLLRDTSTATVKPYSFSNVQFAWWMTIVLSSFITILLWRFMIPNLDQSTLILIGITGGTKLAANAIDISDQSNPKIERLQNSESDYFLLDILSDSNGVSIHRLQTVIFNVVFGLWFITTVLYQLHSPVSSIDTIIPKIEDRDLILLGLSSGTYAALKTTENKAVQTNTQPDVVRDEALTSSAKGEG